MIDASESTGRDSLGASPAALGAARIGIGVAQGLGLFWLHRASDGAATWPATQPLLFGPLLLVIGFLPIMLLAGVGRLRLMTLAIWTAVAGVCLALLGLHDIAGQSAETLDGPPFLSPPVILFSAAALFIAHHLVAPADMERRRIATYPAYFDTATKSLVQLALSIGFTGAFWALLHLGAALFRIIGLDFLEDLLRKDWFYIPVSFVVFAIAVHLTDVRDGLIRGVRTVGLMLLSWLLLVMTVIVAGFVAALPFTGLQGLWETGSATALVLSAAAALIILINAAYQDGRTDNRPPAVLRVAVRVAAVLITPLVVIAFWGLALRVGQHGLTPDRIIAAACAVVGAAFALGYGWAALSPFWRKGDWMRPLERTTIAAAALALVLILALFSPLLDPARLSVADQVARLERRAVTAEAFDNRFLRFESGKTGQAALARLARSPNAEVARRAQDVRNDIVPQVAVRRDESLYRKPVVAAWPGDTHLPASFLNPAFPLEDNRVHCDQASRCVATLLDLNGDGRHEILLASEFFIDVFQEASRGWEAIGYYDVPDCQDPRALIRRGTFRPLTPVFPGLSAGAVDLDFQTYRDDCPAAAPGEGGPVQEDDHHGRLTSRF